MSSYLASKPRYEILDGLRGVAAMIVVAFHLFETYSKGPTEQILNHGYLAVDFFFVLSGYVIGYAYDDRFKKMGTWGFFKRRLIRLQPMVVMGTLIGAALFYFGDAPGFELVTQTPVWKMLLVALLGCFMIPLLPCWDIRGWQEINPLNGAVWSLMWEYIGNILYALFVRRLSKLCLGIFVAVSALLTIDLAMDIDVTGLLKERQWAQYTVIGGFGLSPDQLYIGCALALPIFRRTAIVTPRLEDRRAWGLLVVFGYRCSHSGISVCRQRRIRMGQRSVLCHSNPRPISISGNNGSRQPDDRQQNDSLVQMARCHQLPAIYHPLSLDIFADEMGRRPQRSPCRYTYSCRYKHLFHSRRYRMGKLQTL